MIDGPNLYKYCYNNPINLIDPWGLDTYRVNRKLGGNRARSRYNPVSHTFVATTNNGKVENTYGWAGKDWHKDLKNDKDAAQEAIDKGKAKKEGGEDLDDAVDDAFNDKKNDPKRKHRWWPWNNCKTEAANLLNDAKNRSKNDSKNDNSCANSK